MHQLANTTTARLSDNTEHGVQSMHRLVNMMTARVSDNTEHGV